MTSGLSAAVDNVTVDNVANPEKRADAEVQGELDEAIADVEENLSVVFGRVRVVWKEAAACVHPDLQPVGYKILSVIVRFGETTAYVLSDVLEIDKSLVSRQVRMLEDADLVSSRPDAGDGRVRLLTPTPEAIERVNEIRVKQQNRLRTVLRSRSERELRSFATMLRLVGEA